MQLSGDGSQARQASAFASDVRRPRTSLTGGLGGSGQSETGARAGPLFQSRRPAEVARGGRNNLLSRRRSVGAAHLLARVAV